MPQTLVEDAHLLFLDDNRRHVIQLCVAVQAGMFSPPFLPTPLFTPQSLLFSSDL